MWARPFQNAATVLFPIAGSRPEKNVSRIYRACMHEIISDESNLFFQELKGERSKIVFRRRAAVHRPPAPALTDDRDLVDALSRQ